MTPLEQLEKMRKRELQRWGMLRTEPPENDVTLGLISFAIAVLEMPMIQDSTDDSWIRGYNAFRAEVHQLAEGRWDRMLMERICPHGVGHPDFDEIDLDENGRGIHGCDGCCTPGSYERLSGVVIND